MLKTIIVNHKCPIQGKSFFQEILRENHIYRPTNSFKQEMAQSAQITAGTAASSADILQSAPSQVAWQLVLPRGSEGSEHD